MFIETPAFPVCPSFGFSSQPDISVTITATAAGRERRNRNWKYPLTTFDCTVGPRAETEVQTLRDFFLAMGGQECGFRFKDFSDFKTCFVSATPTGLDQPIAEDTSVSPSEYQLFKQYVAGSRAFLRKILKPVSGTVIVKHGGATWVEGTNYTIDYTTGVFAPITPVTLALTWGGEFDVPVRFNSPLPVQITDMQIFSVQFSLIELRDPLPDVGSP